MKGFWWPGGVGGVGGVEMGEGRYIGWGNGGCGRCPVRDGWSPVM